MKILLLGASGFVGQNVRNNFALKKFEVISVSKRDGVDLTDYNQTYGMIKKVQPEVIVNCAAKVGSLNMVTQIAAEIIDQNLRMLLNIYKALNAVNNEIILINPIANCAYPGYLNFYEEDKFWEGKVHDSVYSYGNSRRMVEVLSTCYKMQYGLKTINYLVPNMYGPFDSTDPNKAHALNALVGKFVKANNEHSASVEVWGSGIAIREWLYAGDFARVIEETIYRLNDYGFDEPINIGQNFGLSVKELVNLIATEVEYKGEIIWNINMPDGAPKKVMDDRKFKKAFADFKFMDFKKGISQTIAYYKSIYPY